MREIDRLLVPHPRTRDIQRYWREFCGQPGNSPFVARDVIHLLCERVLHMAGQQKRMGARNRRLRARLKRMFTALRYWKTWHPVESAPRDKQILVLTKCGAICTAYIRESGLVDTNNGHTVHALSYIEAWMPLPEKPNDL